MTDTSISDADTLAKPDSTIGKLIRRYAGIEQAEESDIKAKQAEEKPIFDKLQSIQPPAPPKYTPLPPVLEKQANTPLKMFQSLTALSIVVASALTRKHSLNAMAFATGAMKGYMTGQKEEMEEAHQKWKDSMERAERQNAIELQQYNAAFAQYSGDVSKLKQQLEVISAKYGDTNKLRQLQAGNVDAVRDMVEKQATLDLGYKRLIEEDKWHGEERRHHLALENAVKGTPMEDAYRTFLKENPNATSEERLQFIRKEKDVDIAAQGAAAMAGHGEDFLKTLKPEVAAQVKALAEGRMAFPSGFALRSPYWQQMLQAVSQYDPTFDAVNYTARAKTRSDFTSGAAAKNVTSLNTVIGHLDELDKAARDLNNSNWRTYNSVKNFIETETGDPRVQRFNAAKK